MTPLWWREPTAGDIVWCLIFRNSPDNIHPRPKPRPALVLAVFDDDAPHGQTPRLGTLHPSLVQAAGAAYLFPEQLSFK